MPSGLDPDRAQAPAVLMLDVGQGDASLILLPGSPRRAVVVDCNDAHVVLRHLADFEVERLAAIVFTHLDSDHIGGGLSLLRAWTDRTDAVYVSADGRTLTDDVGANQRAKELLDALIEHCGGAKLGQPELRPPTRDARAIAEGEAWRVRIVAPDHRAGLIQARTGNRRTANEHSAVVRIERDTEHGQIAVLIGGDAPLATWAEVPEADHPADVFRVPHHGGALDDGALPAECSADRLYDAVEPKDAVISVGTNNRHGHPAPNWVAPLQRRAGCHVRCTQVTSSCHASLGSDDAADLRRRVLAARGRAEPAYRHLTATRYEPRRDKTFREVPCAGTVAAGLSSDGRVHVWPRAEDHLLDD